MNEVFNDIEKDKNNKRREEEMTGKILMSVTEVKHGFLSVIDIILVIISKEYELKKCLVKNDVVETISTCSSNLYCSVKRTVVLSSNSP